MAAIVDMSHVHTFDISPQDLKPKEKFEIEDDVGEKKCGQNESENEKTEKGCGCEGDGPSLTKEVKIDVEAAAILEINSDTITSRKEKKVGLPSDATAPTCSSPEDFSQEIDAPEVTGRVYDFNMVKQKTLPRISFGNKNVFRAFSSHSKSYIILWTLMPISLVICIIILLVYWVG